MLEVLKLKPEAFGLDISDLSLKIIKLEKKRGVLNLASFGETPIKPGIIKEGEIKNEKSLAKIIKKAITEVEGKKINSKHVVVSLPEEKAFLQVIQMPRLPEEDLKSAVVYEAENHIPLPVEEVYLDSQIISPIYNHLDHYDVLIAALPKKTVDPYISCLKTAGLEPLVLEIESLAIARTLIKNKVTSFPVLIIDLGSTRTSFIIFSGHSLRFTSSIPVSSQKFTEAISQTMKIDLISAEKLKLKYGLETKTREIKRQIFDALIPPLTDLIEQIKKHLDYYQSHASHEHLLPSGKGVHSQTNKGYSKNRAKRSNQSSMGVKKILLCGGGANLIGLTNFLSNELNLPVEPANPWINILPKVQEKILGLSSEKSLSYTTAIGLALRGVKNHD